MEEKEKWFLQYNLGKSQICKMEHQVNIISFNINNLVIYFILQLTQLHAKLNTKDAENIALKKEIDVLKREIKVSTQSLNANESKLNKALEENDKNKSLLKSLKKSEKV